MIFINVEEFAVLPLGEKVLTGQERIFLETWGRTAFVFIT